MIILNNANERMTGLLPNFLKVLTNQLIVVKKLGGIMGHDKRIPEKRYIIPL